MSTAADECQQALVGGEALASCTTVVEGPLVQSGKEHGHGNLDHQQLAIAAVPSSNTSYAISIPLVLEQQATSQGSSNGRSSTAFGEAVAAGERSSRRAAAVGSAIELHGLLDGGGPAGPSCLVVEGSSNSSSKGSSSSNSAATTLLVRAGAQSPELTAGGRPAAPAAVAHDGAAPVWQLRTGQFELQHDGWYPSSFLIWPRGCRLPAAGNCQRGLGCSSCRAG